MIRPLIASLSLLITFQVPLAGQESGDSLVIRVEGRPVRVLHAADLRADALPYGRDRGNARCDDPTVSRSSFHRLGVGDRSGNG